MQFICAVCVLWSGELSAFRLPEVVLSEPRAEQSDFFYFDVFIFLKKRKIFKGFLPHGPVKFSFPVSAEQINFCRADFVYTHYFSSLLDTVPLKLQYVSFIYIYLHIS